MVVERRQQDPSVVKDRSVTQGISSGETAQVEDFVSLDDVIARRGPAREYARDEETGLDMQDDCAVDAPGFDPEDDVVGDGERF